jgi:hypothetical protein
VCKADNLPDSSADVSESESLNLPEPSGSHMHVMGLLYLNIVYETKEIVIIAQHICVLLEDGYYYLTKHPEGLTAYMLNK